MGVVMKDLFDELPRSDHVEFLVDTCFLYYILSSHVKPFEIFCNNYLVGITSFNVEEVLHHIHHVNTDIRDHLRHLLKNGIRLHVVEIDVFPGNAEKEKEFVSKIDANLLRLIPDPSDAVLVAAALPMHAAVLTRDKHHLFTTKLENYMRTQLLSVWNNLP